MCVRVCVFFYYYYSFSFPAHCFFLYCRFRKGVCFYHWRDVKFDHVTRRNCLLILRPNPTEIFWERITGDFCPLHISNAFLEIRFIKKSSIAVLQLFGIVRYVNHEKTIPSRGLRQTTNSRTAGLHGILQHIICTQLSAFFKYRGHPCDMEMFQIQRKMTSCSSAGWRVYNWSVIPCSFWYKRVKEVHRT